MTETLAAFWALFENRQFARRRELFRPIWTILQLPGEMPSNRQPRAAKGLRCSFMPQTGSALVQRTVRFRIRWQTGERQYPEPAPHHYQPHRLPEEAGGEGRLGETVCRRRVYASGLLYLRAKTFAGQFWYSPPPPAGENTFWGKFCCPLVYFISGSGFSIDR